MYLSDREKELVEEGLKSFQEGRVMTLAEARELAVEKGKQWKSKAEKDSA